VGDPPDTECYADPAGGVAATDHRAAAAHAGAA
jgi:hypothetical protein